MVENILRKIKEDGIEKEVAEIRCEGWRCGEHWW